MAVASVLFNSRVLSAQKHTHTRSAWQQRRQLKASSILNHAADSWSVGPLTLPQFSAVSIKFHLCHHVRPLDFTHVSKEAAVGKGNWVYKGKGDGEGSLARTVCKIQQ